MLQESKKPVPALSLTGATLPPGITLDEVEKLIEGQIKKELTEAFKKWELKRLTIRLHVEKGKVMKVKVVKYQGKECKKEQLKEICRKLIFPTSLKGSVKLILEYT